ncbi:MAG: type II secretion system F family protein [Actinomycetota bacterium]|nr:type II secretion system F family protein [Actinomycetota bacterium]
MSLYLLIGFACLAGAAFLVGEVATLPARERQGAVRRASTYGRFRMLTGERRIPFRERVVLPATASLAELVLKLNPKTSVESVRLKLLSAGLSDRVSVNTFLAVKAVGAALGLLLGVMFGVSAGPLGALAFTAAFAVGGFWMPSFLLSTKTRRRREQIKAELPDALDLLAVSVEAGLGFDGAIVKLTENMEGALIEEFSLTLGEIRVGEGRQEALKRMAERVDTPEVSAFTRSIIQADQLGISLGRILRVQAADTRLRRQAAAEEKAMKAPIKMLFPTVAFIFPAMFIVILGPAFINIMKVF